MLSPQCLSRTFGQGSSLTSRIKQHVPRIPNRVFHAIPNNLIPIKNLLQLQKLRQCQCPQTKPYQLIQHRIHLVILIENIHIPRKLISNDLRTMVLTSPGRDVLSKETGAYEDVGCTVGVEGLWGCVGG